jgi:hypothetical protein
VPNREELDMRRTVLWMISSYPGIDHTFRAIFEDIKRATKLDFSLRLMLSRDIDAVVKQLEDPNHYICGEDPHDSAVTIFVACDLAIGESFLGKFRLYFPTQEVILLDDGSDVKATEAARRFQNCHLIAMDREMGADLRSLFQREVLGRKSNQDPRGTLEVTVGPTRIGYSYSAKDPRSGHWIRDKDQGTGKITAKEWEQINENVTHLKKLANDEADNKNFIEQLKAVGEDIWNVIFKVPNFARDFAKLRGFFKNELRNLQIVITVKDTSFELPAEVLFDREADEFLMFQMPILRQLAYFESSIEPLFKQDNESLGLRILVIDAANKRNKLWKEEGQKMSALRCGDEEVEIIEKYGHDSPDSTNLVSIECVKVVKVEPDSTETFESRIFTELDNCDFDIVHFIGHGVFRPEQKGGEFVFLLPTKSGFEVLGTHRFAEKLKSARVRFLFLNCCHSADKNLVFQMAREGIPAILGFQWSIPDEGAKDFAGVFYDKLLGSAATKDLSLAFFYARRDFRDRPEANMWAAPILVMQYS